MANRFHTVVVKVENKAGVLARVAGLFARRGFNIMSLAVAPTDDGEFSRITFVVDVESAPLEQVVKQLDKLINVVEIRELDPDNSVERELVLITVAVGADERSEVLELVQPFGSDLLDEGDGKTMLSFSGTPARVDEFEELLRPFGITEMQRTGRVAMTSLIING